MELGLFALYTPGYNRDISTTWTLKSSGWASNLQPQLALSLLRAYIPGVLHPFLSRDTEGAGHQGSGEWP